MRPESLRKFDLFYIAAIGIGLASGLLNFDSQLSLAERQFAETGLADYAGSIVLLSAGIAFAFNLLLWFMASRLRMGWVKWLISLMVVYSLGIGLMGLTASLTVSGLTPSISITGMITVLLKAIAVSFLFRKDALEWFASKAE